MCTSFVFRGEDTIIGMNFDNNGMDYSIDTKTKDWFVALVNGGRGKYPSFGVNMRGIFFSNLVVNSNGKGLYRRPSAKVTHTTKLISDIYKGALSTEGLHDYLNSAEVVNTPDWSCHNMIVDSKDGVFIVEPGRGHIYSAKDESRYVVMANESILDMRNNQAGSTCERYKVITRGLEGVASLDVPQAFSLLEKAFQKGGEWQTALTLVFSKNEGKVYYCRDRMINQIDVYGF
jgi:hypothetical protein